MTLIISVAALLLMQSGEAPAPLACAGPITQSEMTACAAQDWQEADAELNRQWQNTAAMMRQRDAIYDHSHDRRPGYFDQLLAAQNAWLAYRDAHCVSEGYIARGGSLEPMLVAQCKAALTRERIHQLQSIEAWLE